MGSLLMRGFMVMTSLLVLLLVYAWIGVQSRM